MLEGWLDVGWSRMPRTSLCVLQEVLPSLFTQQVFRVPKDQVEATRLLEAKAQAWHRSLAPLSTGQSKSQANPVLVGGRAQHPGGRNYEAA